MNTCKSVSKQSTLTIFRINTYAKQGGGGHTVNQRRFPLLHELPLIERGAQNTSPVHHKKRSAPTWSERLFLFRGWGKLTALPAFGAASCCRVSSGGYSSTLGSVRG